MTGTKRRFHAVPVLLMSEFVSEGELDAASVYVQDVDAAAEGVEVGLRCGNVHYLDAADGIDCAAVEITGDSEDTAFRGDGETFV